MANATACIMWVLRQEDAALSGKVVDLNDGAGPTRFGITQAVNPPADFYTTASALALQDAISIYRAKFWQPLNLDQVVFEPLAASLLSFGINDGERFAAKMFQQILGVTPDGVYGPETIAAINSGSGPLLLSELQNAQWQHYQDVAAKNPNDVKDLAGWQRRAFRTYPSLA